MMQPCLICQHLISLVALFGEEMVKGGTKEMMQPCLIYRHLISLVALFGRGAYRASAGDDSRPVGRGEDREEPDLAADENCHFADALSPSRLTHLLKVEGGAAE